MPPMSGQWGLQWLFETRVRQCVKKFDSEIPAVDRNCLPVMPLRIQASVLAQVAALEVKRQWIGKLDLKLLKCGLLSWLRIQRVQSDKGAAGTIQPHVIGKSNQIDIITSRVSL